MPETFRLFGSELSPYSVKVRSALRFKQIPHEWIVRGAASEEEFRRWAKLPLIPLLVTPDGRALQDSTPILEEIEALVPEPWIQPADPVLRFLAALFEEYADEWGNKPMFHYRWTYPADQDSAAGRIVRTMMPDLAEDEVAAAASRVKERMVPRLRFVGSAPQTRQTIEGSFRLQVEILEAHLATRPYLFGGRPTLADFGLAPQLYECLSDPTPGALLRREAPRVVAWIERMLSPAIEGELEGWPSLETGLRRLLETEVAGIFLPWSDANARALAAGEERFTVELAGRPFTQDAQKYHAKSLRVLRERRASASGNAALDAILAETGCAAFLRL
jgi:glutathione S-transferase